MFPAAMPGTRLPLLKTSLRPPRARPE